MIVTLFSGVLINKSGRRTLMLIGQSMVVGSLFLAFFGEMFKSENMVVVMVFVHIVGFSISLGPISMLYAAELMDNLTLVGTIIWVLTLIVSMTS